MKSQTCRRCCIPRLTAACLAWVVAASLVGLPWSHRAEAAELELITAGRAPHGAQAAYDGVVEAVRQTVVAAQVSGTVLGLQVKVGDRVAAGQLLLRLDARAAEQSAAAGDAQVRAARAAQAVAAKEYARQKQLAADEFISAAALDRAEAEHKAAQAQVAAQLALALAARTHSGFYAVHAPFAGVVTEVPVALGEMAMPGRAVVTLFDPSALRVSASVPQSVAAVIGDGRAVRVEIPSAPAAQRMQSPARVQVLPAADLATHTLIVRAELAPGVAGAMPGQFARLWLPAPGAAASPWVPAQAIVRRAEMTGLYVLDRNNKPLLRQVRLGRTEGVQVEVLAGLAYGERVAADAQKAARVTAIAK